MGGEAASIIAALLLGWKKEEETRFFPFPRLNSRKKKELSANQAPPPLFPTDSTAWEASLGRSRPPPPPPHAIPVPILAGSPVREWRAGASVRGLTAEDDEW